MTFEEKVARLSKYGAIEGTDWFPSKGSPYRIVVAVNALAPLLDALDEAEKQAETWQRNWANENENLERVSAADQSALALSQAATDAAIRIGERAQVQAERLRAVLRAVRAPHENGCFIDAYNGGRGGYCNCRAREQHAIIDAALSPSPANEQADKEQG